MSEYTYDRSYERWQEHLPPERLGSIYDRIGWEGWREMYRKDIIQLVRNGKNPNILDVGCFRGDFLQVLMEENAGFDYTGIDVTPEYVDYATQRFQRNSRGLRDKQKFRFQEGNVFYLEFPDDVFDIVIFTGVLHHLPEIDRPLDEVFRVAKGSVLLGLYVHEEEESEIITLKNGFLYKTWSQPFIFGKIEERGNIVRATFHPSPDYDYKHCSIVATKLQRKRASQNI